MTLYQRGTHRIRPPVQTWEDFGRHRDAAGITRVANMTGLDRVGIPVYNAIRPNARSLSVSQGKGTDHDAARVSALMESLEYWHAEHIDAPLREDSCQRLRRHAPVVDVAGLPLRAGLDSTSPRSAETPARATLAPHKPLLWIEGRDLLTGGPLWVPYETVTYNRVGLDYARTTFRVSSSGLASGNDLTEAIIHGICELIERDALTLWWASGPRLQATLVRPDSVDDPLCRSLLALLNAAELDVLIWDVTSDLGVPTFQACILERHEPPEWRPFGPCWGYGCHLAPEVALSRAITEAAQSRVTVMVSSRDDNFGGQYEVQHDRAVHRSARELFTGLEPRRAFAEAPRLASDSLAEDLEVLIRSVAGAGISTIAVVDLTKQELGVPVVKVVIPGLEFFSLQIGYSPGPRARQAAGQVPHG